MPLPRTSSSLKRHGLSILRGAGLAASQRRAKHSFTAAVLDPVLSVNPLLSTHIDHPSTSSAHVPHLHGDIVNYLKSVNSYAATLHPTPPILQPTFTDLNERLHRTLSHLAVAFHGSDLSLVEELLGVVSALREGLQVLVEEELNAREELFNMDGDHAFGRKGRVYEEQEQDYSQR
ncbi:hypothetical protein OF83DRAFT_1177945 [Amylostereum chailletii]|nr:hypothetical protein OF83DRAFT_1177945 [Amylostereum chailletii]